MADLNKNIFGLKVENHELLGRAYRAYLANGRSAGATTKQRGDVRGGGRKPWQQKGTGRARIGSIRAPHWRGGGVTFGPTGDQNYQISIPTTAKRVAIRQALSVQNQDKLILTFPGLKLKAAKTKTAVEFLKAQKVADKKRVLIVVGAKEPEQMRAFANLQSVKLISAKYLNVYDILNADSILISTESLKIIDEWLDAPAKTAKPVAKESVKASAKAPAKAPVETKEAKK